MKVILANEVLECRLGYLNILDKEPDLTDVDPLITYQISEFYDFKDIISYGEVDELVIPSLIEYLPNDKLMDFIKKWIEYVAIGGTISISGTELLEVAHALSIGHINENVANRYLFPKLGCYSLKQIIGELELLGLEIQTSSIDKLKYLVKAKRVK